MQVPNCIRQSFSKTSTAAFECNVDKIPKVEGRGSIHNLAINNVKINYYSRCYLSHAFLRAF